VHVRQNLYEAVVSIEALEGRWTITDLQLLDERRLDPNAAVAETASGSSR
jgi:hypothetical protein